MNWINDTILIMGGMQACGLTLEKTPTEGQLAANLVFQDTISAIDFGDVITPIDMMNN